MFLKKKEDEMNKKINVFGEFYAVFFSCFDKEKKIVGPVKYLQDQLILGATGYILS